MTTVYLSAPADDALAAIVRHRRREVGFMAARALRERIMGQIYQLRDFPALGRRTLQSQYDDRRELIVSPYRIPYRIVGDTVVILNIIDARYDFSDSEEDEIKP
ncbi:MAG: type II toxin-antitoxin system RelE/ParE family toxin [Thermomicrobia bacterium]|nr:type II toxin-antitoxin system RelE/ParE family toxin [Thermomicrobia bacterium]